MHFFLTYFQVKTIVLYT